MQPREQRRAAAHDDALHERLAAVYGRLVYRVVQRLLHRLTLDPLYHRVEQKLGRLEPLLGDRHLPPVGQLIEFVQNGRVLT